jgi:hypothetical protein
MTRITRTDIEALDAQAIALEDAERTRRYANEDEYYAARDAEYEERGEVAVAPRTMLCHTCGGYEGQRRAVVALGLVVNQADPTQTYTLSCGHGAI